MAKGKGRKNIEEIETMLENMKLDGGLSMQQLKRDIRERGVCLRNGKEYGPKLLPYMLKKYPELVVPKKAVKGYPPASKCRVTVSA